MNNSIDCECVVTVRIFARLEHPFIHGSIINHLYSSIGTRIESLLICETFIMRAHHLDSSLLIESIKKLFVQPIVGYF